MKRRKKAHTKKTLNSSSGNHGRKASHTLMKDGMMTMVTKAPVEYSSNRFVFVQSQVEERR